MPGVDYPLHAELFEKLKLNPHANIVDELISSLRQMIISGDLPPGYSFPNETAFCDQLGIGRTTLREAYKALESGGFISRTKRGTLVNSSQDIAEAIPFSMMIEMSDFAELLEFRTILEGELAALAAKRATPENIANLKKYLCRMEANRTDMSLLTRYDTDFHLEIANATQNRLLINTMSSSSDTFFKAVYRAFQVDTDSNVDQALHYHRLILNALACHDSAKAKKMMTEHIAAVISRVS